MTSRRCNRWVSWVVGASFLALACGQQGDDQDKDVECDEGMVERNGKCRPESNEGTAGDGGSNGDEHSSGTNGDGDGADDTNGDGDGDGDEETNGDGDQGSCDPEASDPFGGGEGTASRPYLLCAPHHFELIAGYSMSHFLLTRDIDMNGVELQPIGFSGVFDGSGHQISNLVMERDSDYTGLFGWVESGVIRHLILSNPEFKGTSYVGALAAYVLGGEISDVQVIGGSVSGSGTNIGGIVGTTRESRVMGCSAAVEVSGGSSVGGLIGMSSEDIIADVSSAGAVDGEDSLGGLIGGAHDTVIQRSHATGPVSGTGGYVAGLVSSNTGGGIIEECYATGSVTSMSSFIGGLVGGNEDSVISRSYAAGDVISPGSYVAGLSGTNYGTALIENSYAMGDVEGFNLTGGLVGRNTGTIEGCYAQGEVSADDSFAGLVGDEEGSTANSYFNTANPDGGSGTALSLEEFASAASFVGWDFVGTWQMSAAGPRLAWE